MIKKLFFIGCCLVAGAISALTVEYFVMHVEGGKPILPFIGKPAKPFAACWQKKTCGQMYSCEEAYYFLRHCKKDLDKNKNGIPCETLCKK